MKLIASFLFLLVLDIQASARTEKSIAVLQSIGASGVSGWVTFTRVKGGVEVVADVIGLAPGSHGFHIHEFGDCSARDGSSAGGHFNPTGHRHGSPIDQKRHVGDLGNLMADTSGRATRVWTDKRLRLSGPNSIIGRSVIIHEKTDDLVSQPTGNAGGRIACGVIGIAKAP